MSKTTNEYAEVLAADVYAAIPKAVLAAIAVSYLSSGGSNLSGAEGRLLHEWRTLHANGIVPQPLPRKFADRADRAAVEAQ